MKPKIKKVVKKFKNGRKFVSYEYKGKKYNTKAEIMTDIRRGVFGNALYKKYK